MRWHNSTGRPDIVVLLNRALDSLSDVTHELRQFSTSRPYIQMTTYSEKIRQRVEQGRPILLLATNTDPAALARISKLQLAKLA